MSRLLNNSRISHEKFQQVQDQMRHFEERKQAIREEAGIKREVAVRRKAGKRLEESAQRFEREKEEAVESVVASAVANTLKKPVVRVRP